MNQLVHGGSLKEFFRMVVGEVVKRQRVSLEEVTEFYLVNLLAEYAAVEKLFSAEVDGRKEAEPLALLYHRALQQDREERLRTLRRLGDVSLYTAGYFQQSLRDRIVGPEYYVSMGQAAYGVVAEMTGSSAFAVAFFELKEKFLALVEVLEEISARGQAASGPRGQVELFDRWVEGRSPRVESVLIDVGLLPPKGPLN
jgi:hypothetical protein